MTRARAALPALTALLALLPGGCVLPDRDILIVDEDVQNKHPIRFVEPTPVSFEAASDCAEVLHDRFKNYSHLCQPSDPEYGHPAFLDPNLIRVSDDVEVYPYRFCSCDLGKEDANKLPETTLYVEDRANVVKNGLDNIYAALQLDLLPGETSPQDQVLYQQFVDAKEPLKGIKLDYDPPKRPPSGAGRALRIVNLGADGRRIDLCNDAGQPLTRGYHTLRIIVTDAPWFLPPPEDKDDVVDENTRQLGVPDLSNGATYDTLTYTFYCGRFDEVNGLDLHCGGQCVTPEEAL